MGRAVPHGHPPSQPVSSTRLALADAPAAQPAVPAVAEAPALEPEVPQHLPPSSSVDPAARGPVAPSAVVDQTSSQTPVATRLSISLAFF